MFKNFNIKLKLNHKVFQKIIFGLSACILIPQVSQAQALNQHSQSVSIEGRVFFNGLPLNEEVDIAFEVYADGFPTCTLYRDIHERVNVGDPEDSSRGYFSEQLGAGAVQHWVPSGSMTQVFANNTSLLGESCSLSAAQLNGRKRYVRIKVKKPTESTWVNLDEGVALTSVPTAMVAETLQGHYAADFFQNTGGTADQTKLYQLLGLNFTDLTNTISGSNSNYVRANSGGATLPSYSSDPSGSAVAGQMWYNTTDGAIKYKDSSGTVVTVGKAGDGIQNVVGGNGVSATTTGGSVTVTSSVDNTSIDINGSQQLQIKTGGVTSAKIADGTITNVDIADMDIGKITSSSNTTSYFKYTPAGTACSNGQTLKWDNVTQRWICANDTDTSFHSLLGGLTNDDHTQYVLLAGRSGGQILYGGIAAGNSMTIESTSHATKGALRLQPSGGNVGIGTTTPVARLDVEGTIQIGNGGETCATAANAGMIKYDSGNVMYCNGSSWQAIAISGSGMQSLNGLSASTQTFTMTATGTAPGINSSVSTHTFSIPLASGAGVTSGTISKADYDNFSSKLGAVAGSPLASGYIWIGNASNQAAALQINGDATVSNTGALTIGSGTVNSTKILDGSIMNVDINAAAAIAWTKINKSGAVATDVGAAPSGRFISTAAGSGLTGGGDLSADRSLAVSVDNTTIGISANALGVKDGGITDAKIDTVSVNKIINGSGNYFTYRPNNTACSSNAVLKYNTTNGWICGTDNDSGVSAHGALTGLGSGDDHPQYVLLGGRSTSQTLRGSTASTGKLTLESTAHTNKGDVIINPTAGNVGINTTAPASTLDVKGAITTQAVVLTATTSTIDFSTGNHQLAQLITGSSITFKNMVSGGSYTLIITDPKDTTYNLMTDSTGCQAYKYKNGPPDSDASKDTIVTIMMYKIGSTNTCYVAWSAGWN